MKALLLVALLLAGCVQQADKPESQEVGPLTLVNGHDLLDTNRADLKKKRAAKRISPKEALIVTKLLDMGERGLDRAEGYHFDGEDEKAARVMKRADRVLSEAQRMLLVAQNSPKPQGAKK